MGTFLPFGTWIHCKDFYQVSDQTIKDFGYYPGWHYYLTKKRALNKVIPSQIIIKVSVKGIICTGSMLTSEIDSGVSFLIKLDKIVYRGSDLLSRQTKEKDKQEMAILKRLPPNLKNIFDSFNYNNIPTPQTAELFVNKVDDAQTMADIFAVLDSFSRGGKLFIYFTRLHSFLRSPGSPIYNSKEGIKYNTIFETLLKMAWKRKLVIIDNKPFVVDK
jgi:hypothetical protein